MHSSPSCPPTTSRPPTCPPAAAKILGREPELKADFSRATQALSQAKQAKVARFLPNPEANWGPKPKHGRAALGGAKGEAGDSGRQQQAQQAEEAQEEAQQQQEEQTAEQQAQQQEAQGEGAGAAEPMATEAAAAEGQQQQ